MTNQDITKQAALSLIEEGLASVAEAAWLAGQSRQTMRNWAKDVPHYSALRGLPAARVRRLRADWKKALVEVKSS